MKNAGAIAVASIFLLGAATESTASSYDISLANIAFGNGQTVDISVTVFERPNAGDECAGILGKRRAWLAIGGYAFSAEAWEPFADELFNDDLGIVCNVLAIDLPSHGNSGDPQPADSYTSLSFDNYAEIVERSLRRLQLVHYFFPQTITGHSMGAEIIQQIQARTITHPIPVLRNLLWRFGLRNVVMQAPPPPVELPWLFGDADLFEIFAFVLGFAQNVAGLGDVIQFDDATYDSNWQLVDENFNPIFDANGNPVYAQGAPLHLSPSPEPFVVSKETTGYFDPVLNVQFSRPSLPANTFASPLVRLFSIGLSRDTSVFAFEAEATHQYLVGNLDRYVEVVDDEAIHGMPFSDPATVIQSLATVY